jgi:hypothetical protein
MSKAGLEMLTKYAAAEYAVNKVRVNAVTSCPIDTNCQRYVGVGEKEYAEFKNRVSKNIPLGRMARPDEVAKMIIYLASPRSSRISGQIIKVDGGRSLTSSGFVPWKGIKNMNARFEPDDVIPGFKANQFWSKLTGQKNSTTTRYPETEDEIDKLLNQVNWSTRLSEAHEKVTASYKSIDQNDAFLFNKFVNKNN